MCIRCNNLPNFMNNKAKYIHPHGITNVLRSLITFSFLDILSLLEILLEEGFGSTIELTLPEDFIGETELRKVLLLEFCFVKKKNKFLHGGLLGNISLNFPVKLCCDLDIEITVPAPLLF